MSYQVLARKWRPRRFEDMVGQSHVLRALTNALAEDRLHHAYLFAGTRGVGKTTVARIFAKALNCERGISAQPCGACSACQELDQGRFVDLIEVDAASRTGVDDTRELLENVAYAPTRGRYKVYLIDEVHMFSRNSFNALLKTLEEPPPHVKFLLATTEPKKLPVTILSRCLQFNLKRIPTDQIAARIAQILEAEGVESAPRARQLIAEAAEGSLRDALSLLDQALAFGGGRLEETQVRDMLGTIDRGQVLRLLERVVAADGRGLLEQVARLAELGADFGEVLNELLRQLSRMAVLQLVPESLEEDEEPGLAELAHACPAEDCQLYYQIALIGRRDFAFAPDPRGALEMTLLRMLAFRPQAPGEQREPSPGAGVATTAPGAPVRSAARGRAREALGSVAPAPPAPPPAAASTPAASAPPAAVAPADAGWEELLQSLRLQGLARELASHCVIRERGPGRLHLALDPAFENLRSEGGEARLRQAVQERLGAEVKVLITVEAPSAETPAAARERVRRTRQGEAEAAARRDPFVQALQQQFGASLEAAEPPEE